ncbi:unnamed protein product [Rotaria sp. Silwood2]|nr:unnamed protein product [Rotaria sp. Silwood2]
MNSTDFNSDEEPDPDYILSPYTTIRSILFARDATDLFHKYDDQLTRQCLEQNPDYLLCPYSDCNSGQLQDTNENLKAHIACVHCQRMICSFHRTLWHTGMTCDEYDRCQTSTNSSTKFWLKQHTKSCSKCRRPIEKKSGCDHMRYICRHEFCWKCLANFRLIINHGLEQH